MSFGGKKQKRNFKEFKKAAHEETLHFSFPKTMHAHHKLNKTKKRGKVKTQFRQELRFWDHFYSKISTFGPHIILSIVSEICSKFQFH